MTSVITAPTYDPTSTAAAMATQYTSAATAQLKDKTATATATATALTSLGSAISAFQTSLAGLAGIGDTLLAQSADLSDTTVGSATASASAAAGSYSLFVQQLATASQVSYNNLTDGAAVGGTLKINQSDESDPGATPISFDVDLSAAADTDKDGKLSVREIAAAINGASGNAGKVSAGIVTVNGETRLVLTSKATGAANTVSVDASGVGDASLQSQFGTRTTVNAAQDAIVLLGGKTGTAIQQASNTFTNIDGVSFTATRAQASTESAFTLTVGDDVSGTEANVQAFITAYNTLKTTVDGLLAAGDPTSSVAAGAFANDSGVQSLQARLVDLLRPSGNLSLASYGITAARDGTLSLDTTKLDKQLALNPTGLDTLMGTASTSAPTGVAGALNTYLNMWSNSTTGQIASRTAANTKLQADLAQRQTDLNNDYNSAYDRYLKQYTALQTLQSQMENNSSLISSLFSDSSSS